MSVSHTISRGFIREDGMFFWSYDPSMRFGQRWVAGEKYDRLMDRHNEQEKARTKSAVDRTAINAKNRRWKKRNPDYVAQCKTIRRFRECRVAVSATAKGMMKQVYLMRDRVIACLGAKFHVDHITPLARGGGHSPENLQILPAKINMSKGARPWFGQRSEDKRVAVTKAVK